ncbi:UDP-galactopyranose mutase [Chloroflexus sp.]|uniref:UDP-galactopyranose mutase n=1 Tax=Chloroflexus sp. TaxID=1904827 RepID=UPI002ACD3184|nr:UDP-galactopyranose mutase [Chloroflexus sp.]
MLVDWLIVGAGFTGAVLAERIASQLGQTVLVIDRRDHIAGNAFDEYDAHGVLIHRYGPHIFHTNSAKVWDYLSQFTEWRPYYHHVLALVEGKLVPLPFNFNSLRMLFPERLANRIEHKLLRQYGFEAKIPILKLRQSEDPDIRVLAEYVYHHVFHGYTVKQWGMSPEELDASVTSRVPIRLSYDNRYFQDTYQAMPKQGYSALFRRLLSHKNIKIALKTDYTEIAGMIRYQRMIYTGPIDEFFGYSYGCLPYRSLDFRFEHHAIPQLQPVAQINYPSNHQYTRTTEFKLLTGQSHAATTIAVETPQAYQPGLNDPYYPIPCDENGRLYQQYVREAQAYSNIIFAGRLAEYKYYNMDQVVARALKIFETEIAR